MDHETILYQLYQDFNNRNIDAVLAHFHPKVTWPNGWEGGYVHGHDEVRLYWLRQWQEIDPKVVPLSFNVRPGGEVEVNVQQTIKDLTGQVLGDDVVKHVYRFEGGEVTGMVIE